MGQRIAALGQEFERIVEAGGVRLALIGNRPELGDVRAEQLGIHARLPRRHPVDVAAQGVDLAIVRHHAIGVRPAARRGTCWWRSAGGRGRARSRNPDRADRDNRHRAGPRGTCPYRPASGRTATRVIADRARVLRIIDGVGDDLAGDEKLPLEIVHGQGRVAMADEDLHMVRLGR